jgi:hypothetical protein
MEDLLIGLLGETASPGMRYSNGFPYRTFCICRVPLGVCRTDSGRWDRRLYYLYLDVQDYVASSKPITEE